MQREIPIMNEAKPPQLVSAELLRVCRSRLDAIRLCVQMSDLSNEKICEELGIDPGHFSRMMQGRANFPDAKSIRLMRLCGNYAPMQYEAMETGFELVATDKEARIRELEKQLEEVRKAA